MQLGVCMATRIDDVDYLVRAEELGYTHAWVADSQMIWSDPYATLALAADRTSTIRLGTGVAVAATRPSPVTASSIATINRLAPGRTFCGIGTGNTAVRMMGHKPMTVAAYDRYLGELKPLLRGQEAEVRFGGRTSPVRHLMADEGFVAFEPEIPLYASGFGPKSLAVAGRHGDGVVLSIPPKPGAMARVWSAVESGAAEAGREIDRDDFFAATLTTIVVLEPGEARDSERVRRQCGAFAMASLHYGYDQLRNYGKRPGAATFPGWDDYVAQLEATPEDRRHQLVHRGHNCWIDPAEERFLTPELMEATCLIGTREELVDRLGRLGEEGLDHVMILPPFEPRYEVLEQVGEQLIPALP